MSAADHIVRVNSSPPWVRQQGATLLALVTVIVMASASLLLNNLRSAAQIEAENQQRSAQALAEAKAALIAYAVTYPDNYELTDPDAGPGFLPCPDTNNDGSPNPPCAATAVGRLPDDPDLLSMGGVRDAAGERLWYAVYRSFRNNPKIHDVAPFDPLNSETPALMQLDGESDIVAVIIAPGAPLEDGVINQSERDTAAGAVDIANYLEGDNASVGDDSFVSSASGAFNDRVVAITRAELMAAVEKRVLAEVADVLVDYSENYGDFDFDLQGDTYPWLSPFAKPNEEILLGIADSGTTGTTLVDLDVGVNFVELGVRAGDVIVVDRTVNLHPAPDPDPLGKNNPMGKITGVTANSLSVAELLGGNPNQFQVGDDYRISRFNSVVGVTEGLLPFHMPDDNTLRVRSEPFKTGFVADWNLQSDLLSGVDNGIDVTLPGGVLDVYRSAVERFVESTATSGAVPVDSEDGICTWTQDAAEGVRCVGRFSMTYFQGSATKVSTTELEDTTLHFAEWGVGEGAYVENLDDIGGGGDAAWGVVDDVDDDQLNLAAALQDGTDNQFELGDRYRVRVPTSRTPVAPYNLADIAVADTLVDLDQNFVGLGIEAGATIHNQTTGDWGKVLSVVATALLTNGVSFAVGDEYVVYYDLVETRDYELEFSFSGTSGLPFDIAGTKRRSVCSNGGPRDISLIGGCTVSGAATAGSASDTLVHSGVAFGALFVRDGDVIENTTDGSRGVISNVTGDAVTVFSLSGGLTNRWQPGDGYQVYLTDNLNDDDLVNPNNDDLASITIRDKDSGGNTVGLATADVPDTSGVVDATGALFVQDISFDLEPGDDLPQWFTTHGWHRLSYVAVSTGAVPGQLGNCTPGTDCLILTGTTPDDDKEVVLIAAGDSLAGQDRVTTASSCGAVEPSFFCDYFEGENADYDFDDADPDPPPEFDFSPRSTTYNDQTRTIVQ